MASAIDICDNDDSGNVLRVDDDFSAEEDSSSDVDYSSEAEEYPHEVLSTEEIVQHMLDTIEELQNFIEVRIKREPKRAY